MGSHFLLFGPFRVFFLFFCFVFFWFCFWERPFRVLNGKTKPRLGLYIKNGENKEKKLSEKVNDMNKKFHMEKVNNWLTLVNGQSTTTQWRSMVGEREREGERGVTLVRVTLTWNLFVVAYQVCNLTKNIFPPSKSNFFFHFICFYFLFLFLWW